MSATLSERPQQKAQWIAASSAATLAGRWRQPSPSVVQLHPANRVPARAPSQFEQMAAADAVVSAPRQAILGLLLATTLPTAWHARPADGPLWAYEAVQRAFDMARLVARLDRAAPLFPSDLAAASAERGLATEMATIFCALDEASDAPVMPCSDPLRTLARDLVELFGPIVGQVRLRTVIEPLALPASQRRALVLAGCALVTDALGSEVFGGDRGLTVTLTRVDAAHARLRVVDDGWRMRGSARIQPSAVAVELASVFACEPVCRVGIAGGMAVELTFPARHRTVAEACGIDLRRVTHV
jgi:hypothetical protein